MPLQDLTPQLRTRLRRVERVVGLFVAVATVLLLAGFAYYLYHTAARKGWFVVKCPYYTFVRSAEGLNVGDPVFLMGFSVGQITTIEADPPDAYYPVFVGFAVRQPYYGYIWSDSKVKIAAAGFLGSRRLEITKGYDGQPTVDQQGGQIRRVLADGKLVPLAEAKRVYLPPLEEPALTERAEKLVAAVEKALPNILGLTNRLNVILANTTQLTAHLSDLTAAAQPAVTNLAVITANLRNPRGSLGEWLIPTNINAQLTATLGAANATVTNANTQLTLLSASLNQTLLNLADITSNLNVQVRSNDAILSQISDLVVETDDLVQGLKRHWLLRSAFPQPAPAPPPAQLIAPQIALPPAELNRR